jgi:hypothetical protein
MPFRSFAFRKLGLAFVIAMVLFTGVSGSDSVAATGARRWASGTVELSLSDSLFRQNPAIKNGSQVREAIEAAAAAWSRQATVSFRLLESERTGISGARSGGDGTSLLTVAATAENIALFPKQEQSPPAFTRLFYNRQGAIIEADIVLNPFVQFSTDGSPLTFDLQSVITHEFGHVIGLGHSPTMGATMFARTSQNREDSQHLNGIGARTLSETDVSMVRAVYGPAGSDVDCCASFLGDLQARSSIVWIEEPSSGRVIASEAVVDSRFDIGGLRPGRYRVLAQGVESLGAVEIANAEIDLPTRARNRASGPHADAEIKLIGLNGQLGSMPLPLNRGRTYQIFVGGSGLDPGKVVFGFGSPWIGVVSGSVYRIEYGRNVSAAVLTVSVDQNTPAGDYSIFVEGPAGARRYMVGALSIE